MEILKLGEACVDALGIQPRVVASIVRLTTQNGYNEWCRPLRHLEP